MKVEIEAHAEAGLFSRRNAYIREAMRAQGQTCHFAKNAKKNKFIYSIPVTSYAQHTESCTVQLRTVFSYVQNVT